MLARGILGSGRTRVVSFRPFLNSSGWWWLISSIFLTRIPCHKTTHGNGYDGAWPGWAVSISVLPLTQSHNCPFLLPKKVYNQVQWSKTCSLESSSFPTVYCNVTERSCSALAVYCVMMTAYHSEPSVNQASVFSVKQSQGHRPRLRDRNHCSRSEGR